MKIIKSKSYMRKEAILSEMPVGDPNLPADLTQRDPGISSPAGDISNREGHSELNSYNIYYTYDYDYIENIALNIKPTKATVDATGEVVEDYNLLNNMLRDNENQIKNDIEHLEEDEKLKRQSGYGEPEYDPVDQFEAMGF
jgi:hypothetical protein